MLSWISFINKIQLYMIYKICKSGTFCYNFSPIDGDYLHSHEHTLIHAFGV